MKYLLDTSTLVQVLRRRGHERIADRLKQTPSGEVAICAPVRLELVYGARRQRDPGAALATLDQFLGNFASLPLDDSAANHAGRIRSALARAGTPIGPYDLLIAAIALASGLTLVTCNAGEFARVPGLKVENWQDG